MGYPFKQSLSFSFIDLHSLVSRLSYFVPYHYSFVSLRLCRPFYSFFLNYYTGQPGYYSTLVQLHLLTYTYSQHAVIINFGTPLVGQPH